MYLPEDVWGVVKEFMFDWKEIWHKKLILSLDMRCLLRGDKKEKGEIWLGRTFVGVRALYPKKLVAENYCLKTKLYHTYFRIPWRHKSEHRVSYVYDMVSHEYWEEISPD